MKLIERVEASSQTSIRCAYHGMNLAAAQCTSCTRPLCAVCDHRIRGFPFCQDCIVAGVELLQQRSRFTAMPTGRRTSPVFALLLSLLVPGLGAAYNGQTSKALVHFAIFASFFEVTLMTSETTSLILGLGFIGAWLFAAIDAYRTAQLIRAGLAPSTETDAIARSLYGHSLAWAVVLTALGTLFVLHMLFGVRLPIRELLPIVMVGLGAYMLFDYGRRRGAQKQAFNNGFPSRRITESPSFDAAGFRPDEFATQVSTSKAEP